MDEADLIRIRHMLDAANEATTFAIGKARVDLESDRMLVLALLKDLEIIGEAANRVSPASRNDHQEIPWDDIIGMRNRLIHGYFDVNLSTVWETITYDLPPLSVSLRAILDSESKTIG